MDKKNLLEEIKQGRYYFQKGGLFLATDIRKVILEDIEKDKNWLVDFQNGSFFMNIRKLKEVNEIPFFKNGNFEKIYKVQCSNNEEIGYIAIPMK